MHDEAQLRRRAFIEIKSQKSTSVRYLAWYYLHFDQLDERFASNLPAATSLIYDQLAHPELPILA